MAGKKNAFAIEAEDVGPRKSKSMSLTDWITAISTLIIMLWAGLQVFEMRRQTAQTIRQIELANRPWIAIDDTDGQGVVPYDSVVFNNARTNAVFRLRYTLKNYGAAPANVRVYGELYPYTSDNSIFMDRVKKVCDQAIQQAKRSGEWTWSVIPGAPMVYDISYDEAQGGGREHGNAMKIDGENLFQPTNIGCIVYRSTVGDTMTVHQTPFVAQISMREADSKPPQRNHHISFDPKAGEVPKEKICAMEILAVGEAN